MITSLVTCAGGFQGLALIKALRALPEVRVLVADWEDENVGRYFAAGFHRSPPVREESSYVDFLHDVCRDESVDALFPATSLDLALLARHRNSLEALGVQVFVSEEPMLRLAFDKWALHEWLQEQELPALPTFRSPCVAEARLPLLGKLRDGFGGRGSVIVQDSAQLAALDDETIASRVWQPLLADFDEYSVDFAISPQGSMSQLAVRRRILAMGGFAILCEPTDRRDVHALAHRTIERLPALGARGVLNLQIMASEGRHWVSDLNARAGTSLPLSLAAGYNPVAFLLGAEGATHSSVQARRTLRTLEERVVGQPSERALGGIVFDLDDTLLDQKDWILRKLDRLWEQARGLLPPRVEFLDHLLLILEEGNRSHLFDAFCADRGLDESVRKHLIDAYRHICPDACRLYPDALPVLEQLRLQGWRIGLLTDNPVESQKMKLEVAALWPRFDAVVFTAAHGLRKPDPRAFQQVSAQLGIESGKLAMVGDHLWRDVRGALESGFSHAYHVQRSGAFFNFNFDLAARNMSLESVTRLRDLHELFWTLGRVEGK